MSDKRDPLIDSSGKAWVDALAAKNAVAEAMRDSETSPAKLKKAADAIAKADESLAADERAKGL